ncbi:MAG TPA: hypothetical protein VGO47_11160, partial [Chlamydiales bacterium]|nr:hypothetical protein [Chlamydiales bacterium]
MKLYLISLCIPSYPIEGRALNYQGEIDTYVAKYKDLRPYELTAEDWTTIELATSWMKAFRSATTQMSATKHTTYASIHAVRKGLQDHVANEISKLPVLASPHVCEALIACHRKLSDYYFKIDASPYPIWAICVYY